MNIGININGIVKNTGLSYYSIKLTETLSKVSPDNRYISYGDRVTGYRQDLVRKIKNNVWEQIGLLAAINREKIDILHTLKNSGLPLLHTCKHVLTLCDTIPLQFPDDYLSTPVRKIIYKTRLKLSVKAADRIIFLNKNVIKDVMEFVDIPEEKIVVIPLGVDGNHKNGFDEDTVVSTLRKYNINNAPFIMGAGSTELRKNNILLAKAFCELKKKRKIAHKLVIIGKEWKRNKISTFLANLDKGIRDDIIFTGLVSDDEFAVLYKKADVFVFPSLYEGFGIPPLEAMSHGIPVIISNIPVLSEITGDAAVKVNPFDVKELVDSINSVITNNSLRSSLIDKGYKRVKLFTWERTAKLTLDVYEKLQYNGVRRT